MFFPSRFSMMALNVVRLFITTPLIGNPFLLYDGVPTKMQPSVSFDVLPG